MRKKHAPGTKMTVHVGGRPYDAEVDEVGILRFVKKPDHHLVRQLPPVFGGQGNTDLNAMAVAFYNGAFSRRDYAEMNIGTGYSIDGFLELHNFFAPNIILRQSRRTDGTQVVKLQFRQHDLAGTDYTTLLTIDTELAIDLGRRGLVMKEEQAEQHRGVPGVVFVRSDREEGIGLELRTNVADRSSKVKGMAVYPDVASEILSGVTTDRIKWLYGEPELRSAA